VNPDQDFALLRCRLFDFSDFQKLPGAVLIIENRFQVVLPTFDMGQLRVEQSIAVIDAIVDDQGFVADVSGIGDPGRDADTAQVTGHSEVMLLLLRRGLTSGWIFVI
jgi:hypothetical protein